MYRFVGALHRHLVVATVDDAGVATPVYRPWLVHFRTGRVALSSQGLTTLMDSHRFSRLHAMRGKPYDSLVGVDFQSPQAAAAYWLLIRGEYDV